MEESAVRRPRVRDLNAHLICVLCGGYYVDATTIVDCLHSFCRSCIVRHLETSKFCPICDVQVHKAKPLHSIRPDRTLQTLVYKMVPCLYQAEVQRRREFFAKNGVTAVDPEQAGVDDGFFSPEDSISLSLEYYDSDKADGAEDTEESDTANQDLPLRRRYLQCPAAVSMKHLKKFIRMKFGLSSEHRVDIIYAGECLRDDFTLMDVAYTFAWKRNAPMRFSYRIFHPPVYCIPATPTRKVSTSMPERAPAPPPPQPQEEQQPQQQDQSQIPLSSTSSSTKVSDTAPSRTDACENNGDSPATQETSSPSPQVELSPDSKDDVVNSNVLEESEVTRELTTVVEEEAEEEEEEEEEDNEEEMEEVAAEEVPGDEEPPNKKLCIDERKCDDDSGYEAVEHMETREQEEEEEEVAMETVEEQAEEIVQESIEQNKVEDVVNTETEYKIVEEPVVEKRISAHKSKRRRKSAHASREKEKERSRVVVEPDEVQQTMENKEPEENEEEEEETVAAVTETVEEEEEEQRQEEEEQEGQQEEQQEEEEEEEEDEEEVVNQEEETVATPVEEPAAAEELDHEPDFAMRSSTSEDEEEEPVEVVPSTKPSKSAERQRESKEERRKYGKDSEERRRSKSKRDGSTREYGSRKKSKHKSKHHHRGDDASSSKKQRKAHRMLSEVAASTPTILQYQEDVMKLKVKLGPIKPVIANLAAAAAGSSNHQHRHHHHHHHSKHSRKLQEARESQPTTPETTASSPSAEIWECSPVTVKASSAAVSTADTTTANSATATTNASSTNKTSTTSTPSSSPPPAAVKESSGSATPVLVTSNSATTATPTATTASTVTTTSVTTVSNALNNVLNSAKERLLQMRAVRHKSISSSKTVDLSPSTESSQEETINTNNKKTPTSVSEILMPSSSITVSKVTLGEKRKMSAQKANNSSSSEIKRPSLEIMLVNAPPTTSNSQSVNSSCSNSSSITPKQSTGSDAVEKKVTTHNDVSVKTNRPPPPTIPLVKIRKSSVTSIRAPAGLTITPKLPSSSPSSSSVSNVPNMSCTTIPKTPVSLKMSPVNSPQMRSESVAKQGSSEEQGMRHDDIGALDLSGKSSRCKSSGSPQVFYRSQSSPGTGPKGSSSSPAPSIMTIAKNLVQRQLTNLQHQNSNSGDSPTSNGNAKSPSGGENTSSSGAQGVGTPPALTNLKTLSDTAVHIRNMMAAQSGGKISQQKVQAGNSPSLNRTAATYNSNSSLPVAHLLQQTPSPRSSSASQYHPTLPNAISPLRIPVPPSQLGKGNSSGNGSMPRLRELFPGAVGGRGRGGLGPQNRNQMKPGPNQAVRQIPNPSALLFRQTQNRLQQNAGGMASPNRLHISPAINSINKPVYNSPGLSTTNSKPNSAAPAVSSIRKIENMTRNIEKVAAGLTVRAVEAHVSNK